MNIPVAQKYKICDDLVTDIETALNTFKIHFDLANNMFEAAQKKLNDPKNQTDLGLLRALKFEKDNLIIFYQYVLKQFSFISTNFGLIRHGFVSFQQQHSRYMK